MEEGKEGRDLLNTTVSTRINDVPVSQAQHGPVTSLLHSPKHKHHLSSVEGKLDVVCHVFSPSIQKQRQADLQVQGQPGLHRVPFPGQKGLHREACLKQTMKQRQAGSQEGGRAE